MIGPTLAMSVYFLSADFAVGLLLVLSFAICLVRATASRKGEGNRRARLGLLAILGGPLAGAALVGLTQAFGYIHPEDIRYSYIIFTLIGGIAGFIAGLFFALTSVLSSNES
jgi:hypothetical protein